MGSPFSRGLPISCNQKMTQPELPSSLYLLGQSGDAATVKRLRSDHDFILMKPVITTSSQSLDVFSSTTISIYHAMHDRATSKSGKSGKMSRNVEMATKNRPWNHTHHRRVAAYEYANESPQAVIPHLAHGRLESYATPHRPILLDRPIGYLPMVVHSPVINARCREHGHEHEWAPHDCLPSSLFICNLSYHQQDCQRPSIVGDSSLLPSCLATTQ